MNAMPSQMGHMMQGLMNSLDDHAPQVETQQILHLDTRALSFHLQYQPKPGSGLALRDSPVAQTVTRNAFGDAATISAPYSCVFMRVMVDDHGQEGVQSDSCGIPNMVGVSFASMRMRDLAGAMTSLNKGDNERVNKSWPGYSTRSAKRMTPPSRR
jgi:hypothetical protein